MKARERQQRRDLALRYPAAAANLAAAELAWRIATGAARQVRQTGAALSRDQALTAGGDRPASDASCPSCLRGENAPGGGADDWREARARLRAAGHEVKQFDGVLYVDGVRCRDPSLSPA